MMSAALKVFIEGIGVIGPGIDSYPILCTHLSENAHITCANTIIPSAVLLPPAERRRVGTAVKLAIAVATQALEGSAFKASELATVFASSGGDGDNCHNLCEALASSDRLVSPTRFTNSVHNAPSGYWGIAAKATPVSTSLCAFDASFSAGLLEAATQCVSDNTPVLLIAYDTPYPEPLNAVRPIADSFGIAMLLTPAKTAQSKAQLQLSLSDDAHTCMSDAALEQARAHIPAARCLPLLQSIALVQYKKALMHDNVLELFGNQSLNAQVSAC
jgi:Beta-ketoacyl synthase, N-terminal domain